MQTAVYPSNNATTLQKQSKFSSRTDEVGKALCILEEVVDHFERQFAPVIGPRDPKVCDDEEKTPSLSDFDGFISATKDRIYRSIARINELRERSSV
jgi:hypothetical protein